MGKVLLSVKHFWSFTAKQSCSILLNNSSRWGLVLKSLCWSSRLSNWCEMTTVFSRWESCTDVPSLRPYKRDSEGKGDSFVLLLIRNRLTYQIKDKCPTLQPTQQRYETKQQWCGSRSCLLQIIWGKKHRMYTWNAVCHPVRPTDSSPHPKKHSLSPAARDRRLPQLTMSSLQC